MVAQRLSSAAASAPQQVCQKTNDLARAAVGCNAGFGGLAAVVRVLPASAHHPGTESRGTTGVRWNHTSMESRRHTGRWVESPAARNHAGITGVGWNHPQHTITPGTTGTQHHEPSNHASTTGTCTTGYRTTSAQRACSTTSRRTTPAPRAPAQRALHNGRSRIASDGHEKRHATHVATAAERPAHQPPRAHHTNCQNTDDLARAAVGCMGLLACDSCVFA